MSVTTPDTHNSDIQIDFEYERILTLIRETALQGGSGGVQ